MVTSVMVSVELDLCQPEPEVLEQQVMTSSSWEMNGFLASFIMLYFSGKERLGLFIGKDGIEKTLSRQVKRTKSATMNIFWIFLLCF